MRIGITDSGVGGLSVCAEAEARLRSETPAEDVEVLYLNAALQDDYSYNAMESRADKLKTFGDFLDRVEDLYRPDFLYIACNSLSVLFEDPHFNDHRERLPTEGIIETGTREILAALAGADVPVIVFATPTTVGEAAYSRRLADHGVERVVEQACPGLPDAISNDFTGEQARALLKNVVPEAIGRHTGPINEALAFLGCTHYGYQAAVFRRLLEERLDTVRVIDPNAAAAEDVLQRIPCSPGTDSNVGVRVISPYAIPSKPMASLTHYLGEKSPKTIRALRDHDVDERLYAVDA